MLKNNSLFPDRNSVIQTGIVLLIVLASRIPFLSAGYGVDADSWRVAAVARNIAVTGQYGYSRVPGHPVQEVICSFFWDKGPVVLNGLTALMSLLAVYFFILILKKLRFKNIYFPALAFAMTPIIIINSVNCMDYLWALAFMIGSMYFVMQNKLFTAGILLGIANGCRSTSVLMIVPLVIILYFCNNYPVRQKIRNIIILSLTTAFSTLILFIPVFRRYGLDLFNDVVSNYPGLVFVAFRMTIATWGLIGTIGIIAALLIHIFSSKKQKKDIDERKLKWDKYFNLALWSAIILFFLVFLTLPYKANYFIPIVPLFLILTGRFMSAKLFSIMCISLMISPFLFGLSRMDISILPDFSKYSFSYNIAGSRIVIDPVNGPVLTQNSIRINRMKYADNVLEQGRHIQGKSVVIVDEVYPLIDVKLPYHVQGKVVYECLVDSMRILNYKKDGYEIYYLPGEDTITMNLYNININSLGAKNFFQK